LEKADISTLQKTGHSYFALTAAHIALATVHRMDVLLSWNHRHIANPAIQARLRRLTERSGWVLPAICTPFEMIGELHE
jgi:hypothetical protein